MRIIISWLAKATQFADYSRQINEALKKLDGSGEGVVGAGRTDSGYMLQAKLHILI